MSRITKREIKDVLSLYVRLERESVCGDTIPEYTFSENYRKRISEIQDSFKEKERRRVRAPLRRIIAIAAALALLAALAFTVIAVGDRFSLFGCVDRGSEIAYATSVGDPDAEELILEPSFIPASFKRGEQSVSEEGVRIKYSNGETYWIYTQILAGCHFSVSTEDCDYYVTKNVGSHTVHIRQYYGKYTQMYWASEKYIFTLIFNDTVTAGYADGIILSLQSREE